MFWRLVYDLLASGKWEDTIPADSDRPLGRARTEVHHRAFYGSRLVRWCVIYINAPEGCPRGMDEGQTHTNTRTHRVAKFRCFFFSCLHA